jgi:YjjG family noncanonical pyrimidine nucleotidase
MKYKWLLFDADGTLFDYDQAEAFALQNTFIQIGHSFEPQYLVAYRDINHRIWLDFEQGRIDQITLRTRRFDLLFEAINLRYDSQDFSAKYLANLGNATHLMEGAAEIAQSLSKQCNLAIITNGLADVQRPRFAQSAINTYIKAVIISEEVGAAKPDPKIFDIAFAQMDHPAKDEVLIIGDSLTSDIQGGHNYGIDTCWFNPNGKTNGQGITSTFEIKKLNRLPEILEISL